MEQPTLTQDSGGWIFFVHAAFTISLTLTVVGIYVLPVDWWIRGYLGMGLFFCTASTITLSKTVRDNHEARKIVNRVQEAKTERMLHEFDLRRD